MGIRVGVASLMTLLILVMVGQFYALQCKRFGYVPIWQPITVKNISVNVVEPKKELKDCWLMGTKEAKQAELLNVYFLRVGAAAFFEYTDDCTYICLNKQISNMSKTREEILKMMKKIG